MKAEVERWATMSEADLNQRLGAVEGCSVFDYGPQRVGHLDELLDTRSVPRLRRLKTHVALAAAGVLIAVLGVLWLSSRGARALRDDVLLVVAAAHIDKQPPVDVVARIRSAIPDGSERESLLRNPSDPATYAELERRVTAADSERGSSDAGLERLLAPYATITDLQPKLRFEVPEVGIETWSLLVSVWSEDSPPLHTERLEHSGAKRVVEVALPPNLLQAGRTYTWSVRRKPEPDPEHPMYAPDPVAFRIEAPAVRASIINGVAKTGIVAFDSLLRANALMVQGFVQDAQRELDEMPDTGTREEQQLAARLRAEIALRQGDRTTFDRLRKELESGGK
jgi:hypothetical protein